MSKTKLYRNLGSGIWVNIWDIVLVGSDLCLMIIMAFSKANITALGYVNSLLHSCLS